MLGNDPQEGEAERRRAEQVQEAEYGLSKTIGLINAAGGQLHYPTSDSVQRLANMLR